MVDFPVEGRRGRDSFLGAGNNQGQWKENQGALQNGGTVIVGRAAMGMACVRRILLARFRRGVRLLTFGDAAIQCGCFPMLKKMEKRSEGQ